MNETKIGYSFIANDKIPPAESKKLQNAYVKNKNGIVNKFDTFSKKISDGRTKFLKSIGSRIPASTYKAYKKFIYSGTHSAKKKMLPPKGPDMTQAEIDKLSANRKKRFDKFIIDNNLRAVAIKKDISAYRSNIASTIDSLLLKEGIKESITGSAVNTTTILKPPFQCATYLIERDNALDDSMTADKYVYSDPNTGVLMYSSTIRSVRGASNFDSSWVLSDQGFSFQYQVPKNGKLFVQVIAKNLLGQHVCALADEFGFSDSQVSQSDFLKITIAKDGQIDEKATQMSWWLEEGYTDGSWSNSYLSSGSNYSISLTTSSSYPKDSWIFIDVAQRIQNIVSVNDVQVHSQMDFDWEIQSVRIEVV
jgi:hypothetical protein